jgi:hypothetical protein
VHRDAATGAGTWRGLVEAAFVIGTAVAAVALLYAIGMR